MFFSFFLGRQNFSYGRYHEGRVKLQEMSASFFNAFTLALSYDSKPSRFKSQTNSQQSPFLPRQEDAAEIFRQDMVHTISLLHALCLQHLRADLDLSNLEDHSTGKIPPWDSGFVPGYPISFFNYILPRPRMQARLEFNRAAKLPIVGGISAAEREALGPDPIRTAPRSTGSISSTSTAPSNSTIPTEKKERSCKPQWCRRRRRGNQPGLQPRVVVPSEMNFNGSAAERPYKVLYAVLERIHRRMDEGGLQTEAPILTTMWTNINIGVRAFEHCCYLSDTPFPFPWAQLIIIVLVVWQAVVPLMSAVSYNNKPLGVIIAVAATWILWALNEIAREIEDPFVTEPNDLPLARLQYEFNERVLTVAMTASAGDVGLGWWDRVGGSYGKHEERNSNDNIKVVNGVEKVESGAGGVCPWEHSDSGPEGEGEGLSSSPRYGDNWEAHSPSAANQV